MNSSNFFAQLGPSDEWIPLVLGVIVFMIPIIAILTRHQQKMAEILRDRQGAGTPEVVAALRAELSRLTQAVHQQTIALDNLSRQGLPSVRPAAEEPPPLLHHRPGG